MKSVRRVAVIVAGGFAAVPALAVASAYRQVLSVYAQAEADRSALAAMAGKIDALRLNEFVRL